VVQKPLEICFDWEGARRGQALASACGG